MEYYLNSCYFLFGVYFYFIYIELLSLNFLYCSSYFFSIYSLILSYSSYFLFAFYSSATSSNAYFYFLLSPNSSCNFLKALSFS